MGLDRKTLPFKFFHGMGCSDCGHTGYKGRTVIEESMVIARQMRDLIQSGATTDRIRDAAMATGMMTLGERGLKKIEAGVTTIDEVLNAPDTSMCNAIFVSKEDLSSALLELKKADLGISVVVSGIFNDVFEGCAGMDVGPHTVNMSMGTLGRTALMPEAPILEIVTMCGHSYVSPYLVEHMIERVKNGNISSKQAAVELGVQCTCNFFNVDRAEKLINNLTS